MKTNNKNGKAMIFVDNKNRRIYSKCDASTMKLISTYKKNILSITEWAFKAMLFQQLTGMTKNEAEDAVCVISMLESIETFIENKDYMTSVRTYALVKVYFERMKKNNNYSCTTLYDNIKHNIREMNERYYSTWYNFLKQ